MASNETNGSGRPSNKPGLYRHPETGAEVFVRAHKSGSAMADGVVAQGYRWVQAELPKKLAVSKFAEESAENTNSKTEK